MKNESKTTTETAEAQRLKAGVGSYSWTPWPDNIPARKKDVSAEEFMARQFADPEIKAVYERLGKR